MEEQQKYNDIKDKVWTMNWAITKKKIRVMIVKLKNRKVPGLYNIKNEMIEHRGEVFIEDLLTIFNGILLRGRQESQKNRKSV